MNDLIQITKNIINGAEINSVNARELYNSLGLAKGQYSRWIQKNLIEQFALHEDYVGVRQVVEGNEVASHIITLDTAKHLCMMAKTNNAMKFRKYFIDFEKKAVNVIQSQSSQIQLLKETLNQIAIADQRITKIESNFRIENWQQKRLEEIKNQKVYELVEKHDLKDDVAMIKKLHSRVWKCLKNRFNIPRYNELPICEFDNGVSFIKKLTLADLI